ncbi:hypothetical protein OEZ71_03250 [Defluviimonas sp. WL0050]|uniref:Lipoprotein n=1 Tax=Albidovulum litorale TaxID=2984134 RepID=A0ABT2ZJJ5_9RHOB|nr:hypothetical protein [Defluviimonas sp. WL0050]MCV2871307.1 hypothetical protein [Defluviimonas sp. WL0050]
MTLIRFPLVFCAALALTACRPDASMVSANFQFSNAAGLGTQNAGLYEPGSTFLWNTATNRLEFLDTLALTPTTPGGVSAGDVSSTNVAEMGISGLPESLFGKEGLIKASIGAKSQFVAKGALREDYNNTITALANYVQEQVTAGNNPDLILHPREDEFRIVVVRSVIRANESSLFVGGTDSSDPNKVVDVSLNIPGGEAIALRVRVGTRTACGRSEGSDGKSPACFFNVQVLDPEYEEGNPRMQFLVGSAYPANNLPGAFRSLR